MTYRLFGLSTLALAMLAMTTFAVARADDEEGADEEHSSPWIVSFEDAKAQAGEEQKSILMEFTGSDWCPPCIALHDTVLVTDVFNEQVPENFVLLKLDSPRDKSNQSEEEQAQYRALSAEYKVSGVPTIILADEDGLPYARMVGYGGTPAEEYVDNLKEKMSVLTARNEAMTQAEGAEGTERAQYLHAALETMDAELALAFYADTVNEIIELDADNEAGLQAEYAKLMEAEEIKAELERIQRETPRDDVESGIAAIDQLIEERMPTGELLQEIYYIQGSMYYQFDKQKSKEVLEMAAKVAPDSDRAGQIASILERAFADLDEDTDDDSDDDDDDQ